MSLSIDLAGKVVLVTGASQGIGAQMTRSFHLADATLVLNHPDVGTTRTDAEKLAAELNQKRANSAIVLVADVAKADAVRAMMQAIRERLGGTGAVLLRSEPVLTRLDLADPAVARAVEFVADERQEFLDRAGRLERLVVFGWILGRRLPGRGGPAGSGRRGGGT